MRKEHERRRALRKANEAAERAKMEAEWKANLEKQKAHEKVNHPGRQEQLEEVWEKQDQLPEDNFDPRSFFFLHDLNQDGYWDIPEVEALMKTEVGTNFYKLYYTRGMRNWLRVLTNYTYQILMLI